MEKQLYVGITCEHEERVTPEMLANALHSGLVHVFATPMMIAGIEETAAASVQEYLAPGQTTVGTCINVTHVAATPAGMKVRFVTELTGIGANGRALTFKVQAFDEAGLIGEGEHERFVVNMAKFEAKAAAKLGKSC